MKAAIVKAVEFLTFNKVRGQHFFKPAQPDLRWWWTPWTNRYRHGGWVFLSRKWFKRFA